MLVDGCKHMLEISVPVEEVEKETDRVVGEMQRRARLPGFRPGKAPAGLIRRQFPKDIRQQVLENLVPRYFERQVEQENLKIVGSPELTDVQMEQGEPLRFKAQFEVAPEIELKEYSGLTVPYQDPELTDADVDERLTQLRERKADYTNIDPRPLEGGDFAVLSLRSVSGVEGERIEQNEMMLELGGGETLPAFTEQLTGMSPGDEKQFEVAYPEDHGQPALAGRTVGFHAVVKGIRKKELPELNDDFAQDLGDFRNVEELREALRKSIFTERQAEAQQAAKQKLVDMLVDAHDFPVPEVFVDNQIRRRLEQTVGALAREGIDPRELNLDWAKLRESQQEKAAREVKASLILSAIADRESVDAMRDEVDREVERIARQKREPVAATRAQLEKDNTLARIASHIRTEKTLNFLFDHARKVVE